MQLLLLISFFIVGLETPLNPDRASLLLVSDTSCCLLHVSYTIPPALLDRLQNLCASCWKKEQLLVVLVVVFHEHPWK